MTGFEDQLRALAAKLERQMAIDAAKTALGLPNCHIIHEMMSLQQHCLTCKEKWPDESEHTCPHAEPPS